MDIIRNQTSPPLYFNYSTFVNEHINKKVITQNGKQFYIGKISLYINNIKDKSYKIFCFDFI